MKKLLTLVLSLMLAASAAPTAVFAETGEVLLQNLQAHRQRLHQDLYLSEQQNFRQNLLYKGTFHHRDARRHHSIRQLVRGSED